MINTTYRLFFGGALLVTLAIVKRSDVVRHFALLNLLCHVVGRQPGDFDLAAVHLLAELRNFPLEILAVCGVVLVGVVPRFGELLALLLDLALQLPDAPPQALVFLAFVGEVGLELDILVNHVLDSLVGTVLQRLVEKVDLELEIKVLLGQLVDFAVLLLEGQVAAPGTRLEGGRIVVVVV